MKPPAHPGRQKTGTTPASSIASKEWLLYLVYFIYFFCGMTQSFESVILPELKEYFHIGYQQQMYVVFAKNIPFFLSPLFALLVQKTGFVRSLGTAMLLYAVGTLLLIPGLQHSSYGIVLLGFAILGTGFTLHMVAGNPMISALGDRENASSRLNFGNALGAVAQILAPASLALIIPEIAISVQSRIPYICRLLTVLGSLLLLIALATYRMYSVAIDLADDSSGSESFPSRESNAWKNPKVVAGACVILLALGAEASLFSFFRNFFEDPKIGQFSAHGSQRLFTAYFACFASGRLSAAWLQKHILPVAQLVINLAAALIAVAVLLVASGTVCVIAMLTLGFLVSIFFPTLYALILEDAGSRKAQASGMLTIGFLGAAFIPVLQGRFADSFGLQRSYLLEGAIYLVILFYASRLCWRQLTTATA